MNTDNKHGKEANELILEKLKEGDTQDTTAVMTVFTDANTFDAACGQYDSLQFQPGMYSMYLAIFEQFLKALQETGGEMVLLPFNLPQFKGWVKYGYHGALEEDSEEARTAYSQWLYEQLKSEPWRGTLLEWLEAFHHVLKD